MHAEENNEGRPVVDTQQQISMSRFSGTGEPRSGDVAITVLTALILLAVLVVVAVLG
jgi:hypothetical protein